MRSLDIEPATSPLPGRCAGKRQELWLCAEASEERASDGITVEYQKFVRLAQIGAYFREHHKEKIIQPVLSDSCVFFKYVCHLNIFLTFVYVYRELAHGK